MSLVAFLDVGCVIAPEEDMILTGTQLHTGDHPALGSCSSGCPSVSTRAQGGMEQAGECPPAG